ncbi:citrate lyase subunit beta / citryl-CoA lyase [Sphingomonas guangdongensis]|uniref:Citrate lyase subunit beta / citryl-CoA lyase n=1 Tax=Sphingomonas guangdongensis TaxID=1141890 RepID=A0A285R0M0_9SPHN|nr:CoA ester lyase [Sphingomonas guangdongensis]SOB87683.1 citrate lyase subunit beta / citryl-CoA lyase [Sphingomonas guangdongensis]
MSEMEAARSWLFVPGDSERKMAKALASEADIVLLDLEDAVAEAAKPAARSAVRTFLADNAAAGARLWVRINPLDGAHALADLAAVISGAPGGIMLPKANGRADVERLDHYLSALEAANGLTLGQTRVIALVTETAAAMFRTGDYRRAPRLAALTWGAEDLADAIGASTNRDANGAYGFTYELARSLCLLGAAAAGLAAVETIHGDFRDLAGLEARAHKVRADGFTGMLAIHPDQVPVINRAFAPDPAEVAEAEEIVALFAAQPGVGAIGYKGGMLDRPHLSRAERVLARASRS